MSTTEVITAAEVQAVHTERKSLIVRVANRFGVEANKLMSTLRATAFKVKDGEVSDAQMMALLVVADQYGLNPFTREIYAFPDKKGGIVPVVGVDGWSRIVNEHPQFDGMEFEYSPDIVQIDADAKPCPAWIECVMYRKDRTHATRISEHLDEVYKPVANGYRGPWQTHTKRFLRHKSVIQNARLTFGFVGIFDPDEADRIIAAEAIDVTPGAPVAWQDKPDKISPRRMKKLVVGLLDALKAEDGPGLLQLTDELETDEKVQVWRELHSWDRTAITEMNEKTRAAAAEAIALDAPAAFTETPK